MRLITSDGTYEVKLDNRGLDLGNQMDGRMVDAVGTIEKKKVLFVGKNAFTVKSFEPHKEAS